MGTVRILENLGEARYRVRPLFELDRLQKLRGEAKTKKDSLEKRLTERFEEYSELESEVKEEQQKLDRLIEQHDIQENDLTDKITEQMGVLGKVAAEMRRVETKIDLFRAQIASLQTRINYLDALESKLQDQQFETFCVDYSPELSGDVSSIELNGEPGEIMLAPANRQKGQNLPSGHLVPIGTMTPEQAAFNFAVHPGWQRWSPTYRRGIVQSVDWQNDTVQVRLAYSRSRYQDLGINEGEDNQTYLWATPVHYLDCHALAFFPGDPVVVEFYNQSWITPRVVGFYGPPRQCPRYFYLTRIYIREYMFIWDAMMDEPAEIPELEITQDDWPIKIESDLGDAVNEWWSGLDRTPSEGYDLALIDGADYINETLFYEHANSGMGDVTDQSCDSGVEYGDCWDRYEMVMPSDLCIDYSDAIGGAPTYFYKGYKDCEAVGAYTGKKVDWHSRDWWICSDSEKVATNRYQRREFAVAQDYSNTTNHNFFLEANGYSDYLAHCVDRSWDEEGAKIEGDECITYASEDTYISIETQREGEVATSHFGYSGQSTALTGGDPTGRKISARYIQSKTRKAMLYGWIVFGVDANSGSSNFRPVAARMHSIFNWQDLTGNEDIFGAGRLENLEDYILSAFQDLISDQESLNFNYAWQEDTGTYDWPKALVKSIDTTT